MRLGIEGRSIGDHWPSILDQVSELFGDEPGKGCATGFKAVPARVGHIALPNMADLPVKRLGRLEDLGEHPSRFGPLDLAQDHTPGANQGVLGQGSRPLRHRQLGFERQQASGRISQAKRAIRFAQGGFQAGYGSLLAGDV